MNLPPRIPRPRRPVLLTIIVTALLAFPMGIVLASHQFGDVPDSNPFHADIDALVDSGVTAGCGGGNYCPKAAVTREQMAAFLNRLGALAPGKAPVVNATKVDGIDSTGFLKAVDLVVGQQGPWQANGGALVTFTNYADATWASGSLPNLGIQTSVNSPIRTGGKAYGFKSVEICHDASTSVVIDSVYVWKSGGGGAILTSSDTDRPTTVAGCFTLTDATPTITDGGVVVYILLDFSPGGTFEVASVETTFTPTTVVGAEDPNAGVPEGAGNAP